MVVVLLSLLFVAIKFTDRDNSSADNSTRQSLNTAHTSFPRELRDGSGAILRIAAPPQKIVSQTLATDEILLAITAPERIAGLSPVALNTEYSNIVEQARPLGKPTVKDAEQIIKLKPDLIFVSTYSKAETVDLLRATGAPVFRFASFDRIEDIEKNILVAGEATGDDAQAEALVAQMKREIENIRKRIPSVAARPRVLSFGPSGNTAGAETLFDDVLTQSGAINVAAEQGLKGFPVISSEQVAAWQPDWIVTGAESDKLEETRRRLLADPVVAATRAGKAGKIIIIDSRYFLTVSHHVVRLLDTLVSELYEKPEQTAK